MFLKSTAIDEVLGLLGTLRFNYEYEIEYEYNYSNLVCVV